MEVDMDSTKLRVTVREIDGKTRTFTVYRLKLDAAVRAIRESLRKVASGCLEK